MSLLDLPAELVAQILSYDISWASVLLWKCGNRLLSAKLANGGVQDLSLRDNFSVSLSRWPQFISQLSLRSFSYERPTEPGKDALVPRELRKLKGDRLTRVKINSNEAFGALFPEDPHEGSVGLACATSASSCASTGARGPQDGDAGAILPLSVLWPRLETLKVTQPNEPLHGLKTGVIDQLPSSLTHLEISCFAKNMIRLTPNLPQLRVIRLPSDWITREWIESLPLDNCITDVGHQAHFLKYLDHFPNLQIFPVDFTLPDAHRALKTMLSLSLKLPSTLTTLDLIDDAVLSLADRFPPNLSSLSLTFAEHHLISLRAPFATLSFLPLTSLSLSAIGWKLVADATFWPSSLTSFTVESKSSSEPAHFVLLPRTATRLNLGIDCYRSSMIVNKEDEDTTIEELRAKGRSILDTVDKQRWSTLKRQLIEEGKRPGAPDRTAEIEAIESGALFGLPLGLVSLELYSNTQYSILHPLLPPRVTKAELKLSEALTKVELFPASLDHLELAEVNHKSTHPTWSAFTAQGTPAPHPPTSLRTLRAMTLNRMFAKGSVGDLYCLASGLEDLRLRMGAVPDLSILLPRLPQTLTRLHIESGHSEVGSQWPSFLPRSITSLYSDFLIPSDGYELLPPKLVELYTNLESESTFLETVSALRKLPRSLLKVWKTDQPFPSNEFINTVLAAYRPFSLFFTASFDDIMKRLGHS